MMAMNAPRNPPNDAIALKAAPVNWAALPDVELPLPLPVDGDVDVAGPVAAVVGRGEVEVAVGAAVLATTAGVEDVELAVEELVVEASAGVAEAAQAHTALAEAST